MKMTSIHGALLIAAAACASPAFAAGAEEAQLEFDGRRVAYTSTIGKNGVLELAGREVPTGKQFRFLVSRSGFVRGKVGSQPVVFHVPRAVRDRAAARAASRS